MYPKTDEQLIDIFVTTCIEIVARALHNDAVKKLIEQDDNVAEEIELAISANFEESE